MQAQQVLDHLRAQLDRLMEMGDMVRPEDVIESAGKLVGHGIGAENLARIMSDMPAQGGEGLAGWVRMHDVTVTGAEQQLVQERQLLQARMSAAAIRSLAATHLEHKLGEANEADKVVAALVGANPLAGAASPGIGGAASGTGMGMGGENAG
jgi:hypothetical protein